MPLLLQKKIKNDPWFKDIKTVFFLHNDTSDYSYSNSLFDKLGLEYNKKNKKQDLMEIAINNSDFTYVFNELKNKNINSLLKNNNHRVVGSLANLKSSEKLDVFNSISKEVSSLI